MTKVTATLGRNFIRSKEFQEAQLMGMDPQNGDAAASIKEKQRSIRWVRNKGETRWPPWNNAIALFRHKLVSLTLKRKNKMGDEIKRKLQARSHLLQGCPKVLCISLFTLFHDFSHESCVYSFHWVITLWVSWRCVEQAMSAMTMSVICFSRYDNFITIHCKFVNAHLPPHGHIITLAHLLFLSTGVSSQDLFWTSPLKWPECNLSNFCSSS